jgi:F-type H+-transporting ATPase subunit delta
LKISKHARRDAKQLFRACQVGGLLDEARVRQTVQAVIGQKPRGFVAILSHLERLVRIELERRTARVVSAFPLSSEMEGSLRVSLAQRYGAGLDIAFTQNPALIGGIRVQVGSDVFDGSIQGRLNALSESF